ncbi:MAG: HAMP domain-containing protein [Deltaproteobacteria bacterium]|nr:HAMP domain-containing protein [Deltaproteobacteria bacterium]
MRHEHKILLALVLVAALPTGLSGVVAVAVTRSGVESHSSDLLVSLAREASGFLQHEIDRSTQSVASVLDVAQGGIARFTPEQREAFLSVVYHLFEGHADAALIDPAGEEPAQQVYRRPEDKARGLERHPASTTEDAAAFLARIPVDVALADGRGLSAIYRAGDGDPRVAVAVVAHSPGEKRYVLATEVSLRGVRDHLARLLPREGGAVVASADGNPLLAVGAALPRGALHGTVLAGRSGPLELGEERLGAADWLAGPRAAVVVFQSAEVAFEPSARIFWPALGWLAAALVVALVVAFVLSRGLAAPVRIMVAAARRIGGGALGEQVAVRERGELGVLAAAFNEMSADLRRKQDEIEAWNRELQSRVDRKTGEIRQLQKIAARAQRVAGLAGLAAGMAHEMNNPLQVVIGMSQLARREASGPVAAKLEAVEREARRIADVVERLMKLGERPAEEGAAVEFDLDAVLDAAVQAGAAARAGRGVQVEHRRCERATAVMGTPADLRRAFANLIENAVEASAGLEGARVEISSELVEEVVRVTVRDRGRGIAPEHMERVFDPFFTTKETWQGKGLGLSDAQRIVAAHGGEISLESERGRGTTVRVTLPLAQKATMLA